MATVFSAIEDRMFESCEATFGESFEHMPFVAAPGGGIRTPDASRIGSTVTGIFESPLYRSKEFGSEARGSTPATMDKPAVSVDERRFANGPPQRHDRLRRVATGEVYEVSNVQRDGEGRWLLAVKRVGGA